MLLGAPEPTVKYHFCVAASLTRRAGSLTRTLAGWEFDWGGRLPKSNGGAQWSSQREWQPRSQECTGRRRLDCEADVPSRSESWAE